ncbi:MAG: hypothetical protein V8T86_04515 [Victivallis sp.]
MHDASGNLIHNDIGILLRDKIREHFKKLDIEVNVKYFDTSYAVRSGPCHGADAVFCAMLAQNAVICAMAGHTDMVIGHSAYFTHRADCTRHARAQKIDLTASSGPASGPAPVSERG